MKSNIWVAIKNFYRDFCIVAKYFPFNLVRRTDESIYEWVNRFQITTNMHPLLNEFRAFGFAILYREARTSDFIINEYSAEGLHERINWANDVLGKKHYMVLTESNRYQSDNYPSRVTAWVFENDDHKMMFTLAHGSN